MDLGLMYRALVDQQVDVVAGNATDGQIESLRRKVLVDDWGTFHRTRRRGWWWNGIRR